MIIYKTGDIFKSSAQVITNPVNCVGVMGKGLALAFKKKYPSMYKDYKSLCNNNGLLPGQPTLWENEEVQILNFPTKRHWKDKSLLSDIEEGLKFLAKNYAKMGISSLAMPPIGCGLGGLYWQDVKTILNQYLGEIEDLDVYVYESKVSAKKSHNNNDNADHEVPLNSLKDEGLVALT
jgi:O-acetyl-ADP-ribose deacetylase (regulator of RNase III)